MTRLGIELPVINVSKLDLDTHSRKLDPKLVLDALWDASWNQIIRVHEVVQNRLVRCTMRVADRTAEAEVLPRRRLAGFMSHLRELAPVAPYERRIFLLGRTLAPVAPYTPQLVAAGK